MDNTNESLIKERLEALEENKYVPENSLESLQKLSTFLKNNTNEMQLLEELQSNWREELLEAFQCVVKLQNTINQYEEELVMMMDQMDSLVKCSLLIKQYSLYLKEEIDKVADKIEHKGLDDRIDQLVNLLDEIKPKKHLSLVRETKIVDFPKK